MSAVAVRAMFRSHPEKPAHSDAMSRCIDACFSCGETCTACADACLSERDVAHLVACIRLNLDCAAVCNATGNIMSRSNKAGHRQLLEAQLANCIAFCRACADECHHHGEMHGIASSAPKPARLAPKPARYAIDDADARIIPKFPSGLPGCIAVRQESPRHDGKLRALHHVLNSMRPGSEPGRIREKFARDKGGSHGQYVE